MADIGACAVDDCILPATTYLAESRGSWHSPRVAIVGGRRAAELAATHPRYAKCIRHALLAVVEVAQAPTARPLGGPLSDQQVREAVGLYTTHDYPLRVLADRYQTSYTTIRKALIRAGVTMRPAHRRLPARKAQQ